MRDSVGIFGGAFDPIHKGHTKSLLEIKNLINFSELKIIPCGLPSQKDKTEASNHESCLLYTSPSPRDLP